MTKEEKENIEELETHLKTSDKHGDILVTTFSCNARTALNLIQKQQEEIKKKDKIIDLTLQDLMACGGLDFIDIGKSNGNFTEDKQKLKQHFERKAEV